MRKRLIVPFMVLSTALLLSGCSGVNERIDGFLEEKMLEKSGITADEDYQTYQEYEKSGLLDADGNYISAELQNDSTEEEDIPDGPIHVTFANNRYLQINYYLDAENTERLDVNNCYLNAGDTIYSSTSVSLNTNSNLYRLDEYRIFEYDADGTRNQVTSCKADGANVVYQIPSTYKGTELAIVPVGEYPNRNLSVGSYYINDSGNKVSLSGSGSWYIDEAKINGTTADISALQSYTLKFDYDEANYFYVTSSPKPFTQDPQSAGHVEFWQADPTDEDISYEVELHAYLSLDVKFSAAGTVKVNGSEPEKISKGKTWSGSKLKYGDTITLETTGECTITGGDYQHIHAAKDPINDGYRYTLRVEPEVGSNAAEVLTQSISVNRTLTVTLDAAGDHGTATYKLDGKSVSGTIAVQEGQKLTVTYKITDSNYHFTEKESGVWGWVTSTLNASERTATIPIDINLDKQTIDPDDWFNISKKGE